MATLNPFGSNQFMSCPGTMPFFQRLCPALFLPNTLFQQHKRRLNTWTSSDGQHWNQIDYILCSWRWWSSLQSAKTIPGTDCGSDHEFLIVKFRLKLNEVEKTTRPFLYNLNQVLTFIQRKWQIQGIRYDRVTEELWMEVHDSVQEAEIKTIPKEKKCKKQNDCLRRPYK